MCVNQLIITHDYLSDGDLGMVAARASRSAEGRCRGGMGGGRAGRAGAGRATPLALSSRPATAARARPASPSIGSQSSSTVSLPMSLCTRRSDTAPAGLLSNLPGGIQLPLADPYCASYCLTFQEVLSFPILAAELSERINFRDPNNPKTRILNSPRRVQIPQRAE